MKENNFITYITKMKNIIFKAAALASLVCLLPACTADDDSELLERQSTNGFPVLRKSAEAKPVLGSATTHKSINGCDITISASWSLYKAPEGSSVQPEGNLSVSASASDGRYTCQTDIKNQSLTESGVSASGTIKVKDLQATPPKPGTNPFGPEIGELDYQIIKTFEFSLTGTNGSGTLTVH